MLIVDFVGVVRGFRGPIEAGAWKRCDSGIQRDGDSGKTSLSGIYSELHPR